MSDAVRCPSPTPRLEASMSQLSVHSSTSTSETEDWDRSASDINIDREPPNTPSTSRIVGVDNQNESTPSGAKDRRSLSDLLRLHAEKGKDLKLSKEDEQRLGEELGKWINSHSSPYEPEDDFFSRPSRDDSDLPLSFNKYIEVNGRPRGQSESILSSGGAGSRPPSSAGGANT